jgi:hypothetical protein
MATKAKPTATIISTTTGSLVGPSTSDTFQLIAYQIETISVNPLLNITADGDTSVQWAGPGNAYVDHTIIFTGWMLAKSGSLVGFAQLGVLDAGVSVKIIWDTNHTFMGNVVIDTIRTRMKAAAPAIPLSFKGKITGGVVETASS